MSGTIGLGETNTIGKVLLGVSGVLNLIAGPLLIAGSCIYVQKYDENLGAGPGPAQDWRLVAYIGFISLKADIVTPAGSAPSPYTELFPCMVEHFKAAMAMAIIGGILNIILGLPLLAITAKFEKSILRFARAVSLLVAAVFVVIALILSFTLPCDDDPVVSALLPKAKPFTGFFLIIIGLVFTVLAAVVAGVQAFFFAPKDAAVGDVSEANGGATTYATTPGEKQDAGWTGTKDADDTEGM